MSNLRNRFSRPALVIVLGAAALIIAGSVLLYFAVHPSGSVATLSYSGPVPAGALVRLGKGGISTFVLSPDGNAVAVGNEVGIYLYDARTFEQIWAVPCVSVSFLRFSPDSQDLLSLSHPGGSGMDDDRYLVSTRDVKDGRLLRSAEIVSEFDIFDAAWLPGQVPLLAIERFHEVGKSDKGTWLGQWSVRLVDGSTGQSWQILATENYLQHFVLSPDGSRLAYSLGGHVLLWDTQQKKLVAQIDLLTYAEPRFSPDGKILAAAAPDAVALYDPKTGAELGRLDHSGGVTRLAISPDGSSLAGIVDHGLKIWNIANRAAGPSWTNASKLKELAWDKASTTVFAQGEDNRIYAWDVSSGKLLRVLAGHSNGYVSQFSWSADSKTIATVEKHYGNFDGTVLLWGLDGSLLERLDYPDGVETIAWSPDNTSLAIAQPKRLVFLDRSSFEELRAVKLAGARDLAWSPDGRKLAVALSDRQVVVVEAATGTTLYTMSTLPQWMPSAEFPANPVTSLSWSRDGTRIAGGMWDGPAYIWDARDGKELAEFAHEYTAYSYFNSVVDVRWSPDGRYLVGGFLAGSLINGKPDLPVKALTVWDTRTGKEYRNLKAHYVQVNSIDWSPNSDVIAFSLMDEMHSSSLYLWNFRDDPALASNLYSVTTGSQAIGEVSWSANGEMLAALFGDSTVVVWDVKNGLAPWQRLRLP